MTTAVARTGQVKSHKEHVEDVRAVFKKLLGPLGTVIPKGMDIQRLIHIAMTACQNNPKLLLADRRSLLAAVIQAAQLGLEPDPLMGQAYLVPYKGKVQLQPGYKGLMDLARRSDMVLSINAGVVHVGDEFDFAEGSKPFILHKRSLTAQPGEFVCAWACAEIRGAANPSVKVLPKWFVERIRAISAMGTSGPWKEHYDAQATKTAIKQLSKVLPASVELRRAVSLDDQAETGDDQNLEAVLTPDGADPMDAPPEET